MLDKTTCFISNFYEKTFTSKSDLADNLLKG